MIKVIDHIPSALALEALSRGSVQKNCNYLQPTIQFAAGSQYSLNKHFTFQFDQTVLLIEQHLAVCNNKMFPNSIKILQK